MPAHIRAVPRESVPRHFISILPFVICLLPALLHTQWLLCESQRGAIRTGKSSLSSKRLAISVFE